MTMKRDLAAKLLPNGLPLAVLRDNGTFVRIRNEKLAECQEFHTDHPDGAGDDHKGRFGLYQHLASQIAGPIDYLEFGVWEGRSIKQWAQLNTHPDSRFYGFDTFEGLPEDWEDCDRGHFTTGGKSPTVSDPRIAFVKGLFQDTLYGFLEGRIFDRQLVVNADCDIYSASLFVLAVMDRFMRPGTKIILDDFASLEHQFRAFVNYVQAFGREWKALGKTPYCLTVAIEIMK